MIFSIYASLFSTVALIIAESTVGKCIAAICQICFSFYANYSYYRLKSRVNTAEENIFHEHNRLYALERILPKMRKARLKQMKIKLDAGAIMPTRAHKTDAGLDIYARNAQTIPARGSRAFDTGVHAEIPQGYTGFLKSKSGLNVKHGLTSEGVIDCGYTGSIVVKLYNNSDEDYEVKAGDKISQLVILPIDTPELELVTELNETDRGAGGFGSSGR